MLNLFRTLSSVACVLLSMQAFAQPSAAPPQTETQISDSIERIGENHIRRIGHVEIHRAGSSGNTSIYADLAEMFQDEDRAVLTGNVVFSQGDNRITADRAELNTKTGLGTFHNAWGISTLKPQRQTARAGAVVPPPVAGQDTAVYFFGETIEKLGPKKYKITKGGFSTCVQPTPRWDLHADTVILNVDHYTLLQNAVLTVKGVPMFYLPFLYYPTKKEDRATGVLIPTYGSSSLRGQSIHNAFFWAIDRSQDATILHDWFSKTGQGVGSEYRYNFGAGSDGDLRAYLLDQHAATYVRPGGSTPVTTDASRSFEIRGGANQVLPLHLRARANVSYFSSIVSSQTFNTNIYDATRNQRSFGGNVVGAWGTYTMNATMDRSEYFYNTTDSVLSGSWPRVAFTRNERPILDSPVYFSVSTEYARLLRESKTTLSDVDTGLSRVDVSPQIRYPFKKWQWFTVNTTLNWRDTYYTRSLDPTNTRKALDTPINRRFYSFQAQILGPVFNRVWDTPDNGYAEKFKHSVEPFLNVQRTSGIDNISSIIQFDSIDSYVGGTQLTYGLNNRFYAKRQQTPGAPAQSREIINVELTQTYYTNQLAAQYDRQYQTTTGTAAPSHLSPYALSVRTVPANDINATVRAEFDERYHKLRTISAQGTYSWSGRLQTTLGWSKRAFIAGLQGFNDPALLDHYINASTTVHTKDNRVGSVYTFNYDVLRSAILQQRVSAFYNAQCCGVAFEYQTYNYGSSSISPIPSDHRFFLSFTLAGLGNFSPFNGALSGVPR